MLFIEKYPRKPLILCRIIPIKYKFYEASKHANFQSYSILFEQSSKGQNRVEICWKFSKKRTGPGLRTRLTISLPSMQYLFIEN